ncbi:phosphate ABC transporter permease PstA [Halomontanus rarus]|uniref:phosphate ABC transporter permease PstA n=1 Tax=Halomontanus rarus TaxID=3034020 RepID=UPI001A98FA98
MAGRNESAAGWIGSESQVSRLRGTVFKATCLGATLLALVLMLVFLLYVVNDALQPRTADVGWLATYGVTIGLPALALAGYYYRRDTRAGEVAYTSLGLPIAATVLAGGITILFRHLISPQEWFALVVACAVAIGIIELHGTVHSAGVIDRLAVVTVVPLLAVVGIPGISVDHTFNTLFLEQELFRIAFSTPELAPSLREVILSSPVLPTDPHALLLAFTVPVAGAGSLYVRRVRESDRDAALVGVGAVLAAGSGLVLAPLAGLSSTAWIVLATVVAVPVGLYVELVVRRGDGVSGLAFPVVVGLGALLGTVAVGAAGFAGPDTWLTWEFLNNPHSRTPRDAGIYPALVGSVLMLVVVAVAAFPVGVGAAIYLEEYAPNQGRLGTIVELIEINIANLAGVPSVVYGVLGLALFVRTVGMRTGIVLVGGLTIGLLILPIVIVSAQEAIRAVPDSLREASYGMGATKWQTTRNVVLPRAIPGIMTGTILAFGRAIGETAPLLMIGAAAVVRLPPESFMGKFSAMPRQIFTWSTEIEYEFRYGVLAAGVLTLLVVLLMMNASAIVVRNKYQRES